MVFPEHSLGSQLTIHGERHLGNWIAVLNEVRSDLKEIDYNIYYLLFASAK